MEEEIIFIQYVLLKKKAKYIKLSFENFLLGKLKLKFIAEIPTITLIKSFYGNI